MPQLLIVTKEKVFDLYVRMRRSGTSMDEVVEGLQSMAQQLSREERHQLGQQVLQWEDQYKAEQEKIIRPIPQPVQTEIKPFGTRFLDPSKVPALNTVDSAAPVIQPLQPGNLSLFCNKCGRKNNPGEKICSNCKTPLKPVSYQTRLFEKLESKTPGGTTQFANTAKIFLSIRNFHEPLEVHVQKEMILGRTVPGAPLNPTVDLSRYKAEELGVSRIHASLQRDNGVIKIVDMQSSNCTYVNGQRIYPQESRVLRHGDEIRLGKLIIKVLFKR